MKKIKTLLIEDNPDDVELLKDLFTEANYSLSSFVHADELSTGLEILEYNDFEVVLLDISLPDSYGPDTFYKLHAKLPETPIIVITGNKDEELIGNLLQNGAQDYLIKGEIDPNSLMHSVRYAIERQRLLVSLKHITQEIQTLRESLEHIVESNADAIMVIDREGIIRFANPAAAEIFERTQDAMIGSDFGFPVAAGKALELDIMRKNGISTTAELRAVEISWKNKPAYLASVRDITEKKQLQDEMKRLSFYDSLTGLYNRAYFEEEAKRLDTDRNLPLCLIMSDVNNLKLVNDALGHGEGDNLLIAIAQILKRACRKEDIVVRFGGDEFVILLTKCDEKTATRIVSNIKASCRNIVSDGIPASIAMGVAIKDKPGRPISDFLSTADERMYANKLTESKSRYSSFISSLETSLYEKDYITAEHAVRVRDLCIRFGIELKLNDSIIDELTVLASLHDIGKITIPASILRKNGPLTDEEWKIVRQHPETGYRITRVTHGMGFIAEDILCHHERWDGKGYPQGLSGDRIPLASRILSVIDTFDVITHDRPYKEAFSEREALNEIRKCSGSQFDPQIADAFISFFEQSVLKI
jgi:diguanylate cyclase (GGDEF)-like protein